MKKTVTMSLEDATSIFTQSEIAKAFGTTQPNVGSHIKRGVNVSIEVEHTLKAWISERRKEAIEDE